jgi:tripartite-type tricarboxylate transporter receptor subunit TctC
MHTLSLVVRRAVLGLMMFAGVAVAQDYPNKPIRLVVPFPPSGPADFTARTLADKLPALLGQTIVVENRPGANQLIGLEQTARAAPDGYTMVIASNGITMLPHLVKALPFDVNKDFVSVTQISSAPLILAIPAGLQPKNIAEFIAYAKSAGGKINFGASGAADMLAAEFFRSRAGFGAETVRYNGGAPALQALLAGDIQYVMLALGQLKPQADAGKVRLIAVTSAKRYPTLPDVPTIAESGVPGYESGFWYGLFVPGGTPRAVVMKLNAATNATIRTADVTKRIVEFNMEPIGTTPEELSRIFAGEVARWGKVAKDAGMKAE